MRGEYFPTAGVGNRVCFVGITSGENCGNQVHMYNANTCGWTPTGSKCVRNVIALTGGTTSRPGDSGGTVFANFGNTVKVTGIVQGHKNSTLHGPMTFITDWRSIKSSYKAKLVVG
ncbi:trypsin-like serine protease [Cutibacterium avidum]|uniref:trypsin-like serine protease n=1 Tax=Cutibacterium avidum TaxID=33010 RepID=UPI003AF5D469